MSLIKFSRENDLFSGASIRKTKNDTYQFHDNMTHKYSFILNKKQDILKLFCEDPATLKKYSKGVKPSSPAHKIIIKPALQSSPAHRG